MKTYKEGDYNKSLVHNATKYTFPCIKHNGKLWNLDMDTIMQYPAYHKFAEKETDLTQREQDHLLRVDAIRDEYEKEVFDIQEQLDRMTIKYQACSNILERLRSSFWQYILFRFKI